MKRKFFTMCFLKQWNIWHKTLNSGRCCFVIRIFSLCFRSKDPFHEINRNSVELIKSILKQGIAEKVFRPVDPERISEVIFMVYKMFIIRMYIKTEKQQIHEMFEDTVDLFSLGLFLE